MATYPAKVIRPVVGNIYEGIDGSLYGYSGEVTFDVTASASYRMLLFSLTEDARLNMTFNCDWNVLDVGAVDTGFNITIDGISCVYVAWHHGQTSYGSGSSPFRMQDLYVPANAEVDISVLNPDAGASLLKANCYIEGKYLNKAEGKASAGVQVGDNAPPPMIRDLKRWNKWEEIF